MDSKSLLEELIYVKKKIVSHSPKDAEIIDELITMLLEALKHWCSGKTNCTTPFVDRMTVLIKETEGLCKKYEIKINSLGF